MVQEATLIATLAEGLAAAFVGGWVAIRLRLPAVVGYLMAGMVVGPFTPGIVADPHLAAQLAEMGVILLMFGVGLHFSLKDLLAVKHIAVPGAVLQIACATLLGLGFTRLWGWGFGEGLVFGLALSCASTVVLLRALEQRGLLETVDGRIAVGWLIVEDLAMVVALVVLPALAPLLGGTAPEGAAGAPLGWTLAITLGKVALFVAFMLVVGKRFFPWLLARVARIGSRELFTLAVLATALGVAYFSAVLFQVSFALGAFFAGMVVGGSDLSHQVGEDTMPLRDAFAVLFFVSVGMLFNPHVLIEAPGYTLATIGIVMVGKSLAALAIVLAFRYSLKSALLISASLAQIGEFSFILASLGMTLGLLSPLGQNLILAGALVSITLNPFVFAAVERMDVWLVRHPERFPRLMFPTFAAEMPVQDEVAEYDGHVVVIGHGRVGGAVVSALTASGHRCVVIERDRRAVEALRERGIPAIYGDASRPSILELARLDRAHMLIDTDKDPVESAVILAAAQRANPDLYIVVRTHSMEERQHLAALGADQVVYAEEEAAHAIIRRALDVLSPLPNEGGTLS